MSQVATGTMTSFGHAPYKDDEKNQPSFYVELEQANGAKSKFWSLGLEEALNKNNIKMGDNIALNDKGLIDGTKKREWEVEKYEPLIEHKNTIANTAAKQLGLGISTGEKEGSVAPQGNFKKDSFKDELDLPESVKNNYVALVKNRLFKDEKINFYDKGDTASIAFEDRKDSLNTSRSDDKTINAMLDVAESKKWSSVSLKGTEEFKQKAWLEASLRGIDIKGYAPSDKDLAELKVKQEERTNNTIKHEASRVIEKNTRAEIQRDLPVATLQEETKEKELKDTLENEKMVSLINTYRDELPDQEMGVTKHTGLAQLQVTLDTYKDKIAQKDLIAVEAYSSIIHEKFKDNPPKLEEKLNALSAKIPDIANGKYQLPEPPTIKHQADISISTGKQGEQDRGR